MNAKLGTILPALCLALFAAMAHGATTVATCPGATPGAVWAKGQWLPCPLVVYAPLPLPATALVADMRQTPACCVFSWMLASNVIPADGVWDKVSAFPNGTWLNAVKPNFDVQAATGPPPPPPSACTVPAALSWDASTANVDNSVLTNLAGYNIYSGPSPAALTFLATVGPTALSYTANIGIGRTYFDVRAFTSATPPVESGNSAVVSKTVSLASSVP